MRTMKIRPWVVGLVICLCAAVSHGADIHVFRHAKLLTAPTEAVRTVGSISLDEELLESTVARYADMRILDEVDVEAPCLVRTMREKKSVTRELAMPMKAVAFQELPTNRIEIVLQRNKVDQRAAALVFRTVQKNYEKLVAVYGSTDGNTWHSVVANQPVYDYTRFFDLRNNRVDLPKNDYAFLRVEMSNISESHQSPLTRIARETRQGALVAEIEKTSFTRADLRIEQIDVLRKQSQVIRDEIVSRRYSVRDLSVEENLERQETVIRFVSCRGPVRKIRIKTPAVNFSRQVTVEVYDAAPGAERWRRIASGRISRVSLSSYSRDSAEIILDAPCRIAEARVRIANMDSPPLTVEGVELFGDVMEAVFLRVARHDYRVLYGAEDLRAPRYDIGAVLENAQTADTDVYRVGEQEPSPAYKGVSAPSWVNRKVVFTVAIILMVMALIGVIAKAATGIDGLS
jgi:hypothetical protein